MAFPDGSGKIKSINKIYVIIPAAGKSERMGSETPKILMEVGGVPVIARTLLAFQRLSAELSQAGITLKAIVVTSEALIFKIQSLCRKYNINCVTNIVKGGISRTESVCKGLEALEDMPFPPADDDVIFIHDGARCMIDDDTLIRCVEAANKFDICAAAVPVKSTIKVTEPLSGIKSLFDRKPEPEPEPVQEDHSYDDLPETSALRPGVYSPFKPYDASKEEKGPLRGFNPSPAKKPGIGGAFSKTSYPEVKNTPKRDELMEVQTPQVFRYGKLLKCYEYAITNDVEAPDDTSLAEALHMDVHLVEGSYSNLKITTPEDIKMAESLLNE